MAKEPEKKLSVAIHSYAGDAEVNVHRFNETEESPQDTNDYE